MLRNKGTRILGTLLAAVLSLSMFASCAAPAPKAPVTETKKEETKAEEPKKEEEKKEEPKEEAKAEEKAPAASAPSNISYKGEITMYAQAYAPVEPTEANPNPPTKFKDVAAAYTALHPDIKVTFVESPTGTDYVTWLKTKFSSGMAPDVVWGQYAEFRGGTYPKGTVVELSPFLDKPNPYVPDKATWRDSFKKSLLDQTADSNGEQWIIDADYVSTAIIYNKAMFAKAGITETPANWNDFMVACQKLKDSGVTPLAFPFGNDGGSKDRITWLGRLFYTNYYGEDFSKMAVMGSTTNLTPAEIAIAYKNGQFGASDPRWLGWWDQIKDLTQYMQKDFLSAAITPDTVFAAFVKQEIAMYFDGSWADNSLKDAKASFEYATFPFPSPAPGGKDKYATTFMSSNSIGGPSAAWQYAITSEKANKSMTTEKLDAVVDWLMFTTTPENNALIVNEKGSFVPTVEGSKPKPGMEALQAALDSKALVLEGGLLSIGQSFLDAYYRTFQQYLGGQITLEEAGKTLQPLADKEVDKLIKTLDEDITQYIKK